MNIKWLVRTFVMLSYIDKIQIAKKLNIYDESLNHLKSHLMDKEIIIRASKKNILVELEKEIIEHEK